MWYARSADFMQGPALQSLKLMRMIGDIVFATGTVALALFVLGLKTGWSIEKNERIISEIADLPG